ncbi:MAG: type IV pilus assembly protein PilM [Candidatus Glassbacteria bacterium]|nr:type IV pilus assembly protein PilM [Candidatus Glassbacteria bacterium]
MIFKKASATTVGLDLGSYSVKMVEMDLSGKDPVLINYGITELQPNSIKGGQVVERQAVVEAIGILFETCQVVNRQVCVGLSGTDVIIKTIQTDRMTREELEKNITWEAEQHVPFPLKEINLDFQLLDPEGTDPQMNVLLVAVKRELVQEKLSLFEECGCEVLVMDVDTFALMNALEANYEAPGSGCDCVVHFGHESTQLGLVKNGLPILTRHLPVGGKNLVDTIQGQLGISEDEAYLAMMGEQAAESPAESPPPDITNFLPVMLDEVITGVNRAAAFLESTAEGGVIERVFLSGGCANIQGLHAQFEEQVGLPCQICNPLSKIAFKTELFQAEPVERVAPSLMLAIGLGLRMP